MSESESEPRWPSGFIDDDLLKAVGAFTIEFSGFEAWLEGLIWQLLKLDFKYGGATTAHVSFKTKIDVLLSLLDIKIGERKIRLEKGERLGVLKNDLQKLYARRNEVVHGAWKASPDSQYNEMTRINISARGSFVVEGRIIDAKVLYKNIESMWVLRGNIAKFIHDHQLVQPSSFRISE